MRYVCSAAVVALSILCSPAMFAQGNSFSITNYQFVSEVPDTLTLWTVTYSASVVNNGPAVGSVTATLTSVNQPFSAFAVPSASTLTFGPVAANGQAASTKNCPQGSCSATFQVEVNRTANPQFSLALLQWSFTSTAAAPIANAGPNQTVNKGSTVTLNGSGSTNPSGTGTLTYDWIFISRPPGSSAILIGNQTVMPEFVADALGTYELSLTVSNGTQTSAASTVNITSDNTPPVANAGPNQTVNVGQTVQLNGSGSTDVNGDSLTYAWSFVSIPNGSQATITNPSSVNPTFVADVYGTYTVQLIVNDGHGNNSQPSQVTITTNNTVPVANAGPNQTVNVGQTVQLNGSGSTDADGDSLTYLWSLITLPNGSQATLSNPNIVNPTFTADVQGTYVAQLTVNDGHNNSATATVTISTNAILAPTANAGPNQSLTGAGTLIQLSGSGTDPQNFPLTYSWSLTTKPTNSAAVLSSTTIANPTFVADLPGSYVAQLTVNNGYLNSKPSTVMISNGIIQPTAVPSGPQNAVAGSTVNLSGSSSTDPYNDSLSYSWSFSSRPTNSNASLTNANTATPSFVPDLAGAYVVQLIVSDVYSSSIPVTVMVTASSEPTITLSPNPLNVASNSTGTLTVTLSTAAGSNGQVVYLLTDPTVGSVPQTVTVPASSTSTTAIFTPAGTGTATISASAAGFVEGTTTVNVSTPAITLSIPAVGLTQTVTGTVTLNSPAPSNLTVNLSQSGTGQLTIPATVSITSGASSATFSVTASAAGSVSVTASATGYTNGSTNVNVSYIGQISVPASAITMGPTQTQTFAISLATGAPASGVTITLSSSNTSAVSISPTTVTIAQGQTTPSTQPTITGVNFGTATISASAPGFQGASQSATVSASLSFSPQNLTLATGASQNLTLNLSPGSAPTGGLTINLSSTNSSAASVPTTVMIAPNASSVSVPVTAGSSSGTATIQASDSPNLASTSAGVTVQLLGSLSLPSTLTVGAGQSTALNISLSAAAPAGGTTVTLNTSDSTKATVSPSTVTITAGQTTPSTQPQVTGQGIGNPTITATANGYTSASTSVTVTAGTAASITASGGLNQNTTVGTAFGQQLVFTVKDQFGNVVPNVSVTISAPSTGASASLSPAGPYTTTSQGTVTVTATANTIAGGPYNISASAASVSTPATISLTNNPGAAKTVAATSGTPQSVQVGQAFANLVATVTDTYGNAVPGVQVTFAAPASGPSATLNPSTPQTTNSSGQVTVGATANTIAGAQYSVTATVSGLTAASFLLTNTAGSAHTVTASGGATQNTTINTAFGTALQVTVTDANGNPVSGVTVSFSAPASGASATLSTPATTNSSGQTSVTATANGTAGSYQVTASVSGANSATFNLTNNGPATITAGTGGGQSVQVGKPFTNPLIATVKDINGNPVPNVTVSFAGPSGSGVASIQSTVNATTNSSGVASASVTANSVAGTYTVNANVTGASTPAAFQMTNTPGAAANVAVVSTTNNQSATVGANFATALQVTVTDSNGNVVPNASVTFTPVAGSSGASGSFATSNTVTASSSGVATANALTANTKAGAWTVTAASGTGSATFNLTNNPGAPATLTPSSGTTPQSVQPNTAYSALSVTVTDANSNPISGVTVTFTVNANNGSSATFTGGNTAVTNASGLATANTLTANGTVGSFTVVATPGTGSGSATFNLSIAAGTPKTVTINSGNNNSVTVGAQFPTLQVTITDANNNPVPGVTVNFTATPGSTGASATFSTPPATNAQGQTTVTATANTKAGAFTVTAAPTTGSGSATFNLTNNPGAPATLTASSTNNNESAAINAAFTPALQVTVTDANSNPVPNVTVTFATTAGSSGANGTFTTNTATTSSSGVATASTLTANTKAGTFTVTASPGTGSGSANFTLTITNGPAAAITASSSSTPQSQSEGAQFANALSVTVTDAGGNPVPNATVNFSAPSSGASATLSASSATTNSSGVASVTATANSTAGSYTVTASITGLTPTASFSLTNTAVVPGSIAVQSGSSQSALVYNAFANQLQAIVKSTGGTPLAGVTVTFSIGINSSTGASATFPEGTVEQVVTNSSGIAISPAVTANGSAGSYQVTASVSGLSANFTLTNTASTSGAIVVTSASVGQNLETEIGITIPETCPNTNGCSLTVTSSNPSALVLSGRTGVAGSGTITASVSNGSNSSGIYVQALASSGSVTVTVADASGLGFLSGTATIELTPSGFVINAPSENIGVSSYTTYSGQSSTLTVTPAQLDPNTLSYINSATPQYVSAVACSVSCPVVTVSSSTTSVGTITTGASLTFTAGSSAQNVTFVASSANTGTTTVTASTTSAGFTTPGSAENTLNVTVQPGAINPPTLPAVGYNLEVAAQAKYNGELAAGNSLTLTSNSPNLLFSQSANEQGSQSLTLQPSLNNTSQSPVFYVQSNGVSSGSASYTMSAPGLGTANGTVNFGPSGFVVAGPDGIGAVNDPAPTSPALGDTGLTVIPVLLDNNGNVLNSSELVIGGQSVTLSLISSNTNVGQISPQQVTISTFSNGSLTGNTPNFVPVGGGTTTLSVTTPAGYSTPINYQGSSANVTFTVDAIGISLYHPQEANEQSEGITTPVIGLNLEWQGQLFLGASSSSAVVVTLSTTDPNLLISSSPTTVGSSSTTVTVPANGTSAYYYLQALGTATPGAQTTVTATATGYNNGTGKFTYAYSGVVISSDGDAGDGNIADASLSQGAQPLLSVSMVPLIDANGDYDSNDFPIEALSPAYNGGNVTVTLNNSNPNAGTVPATLTIGPGQFVGSSNPNVTFTPAKEPASTVVSIGSVGSPFLVGTSPANATGVEVGP